MPGLHIPYTTAHSVYLCQRVPVLWTIPPSERVVQSLYLLQKHPAQPSVSILLVSSQMLFLLPSSNNKKRIWTVKIIKGYGHTVASPNFGGIHNSVLCWSTYIAQSLSKSFCSIPESHFFPWVPILLHEFMLISLSGYCWLFYCWSLHFPIL